MFTTMRIALAAPLLLASVLGQAAPDAHSCSSSGSGGAYTGTYTYLGCYLDRQVSILSSAKLSTIAMTPQYCATFCGARGFGYGGIEFGTQCFCGSEPNFTNANKTTDSRCNSKCTTDPSQYCGATYVMSLYQVNNPIGNASAGTGSTAFVPACQTSPLCSSNVCTKSLGIAKRIANLVGAMTVEEKILNLVDASAGSARLGLPPYEWWNEATHGVGSAPGVQFTVYPADFSYATSFPSPILSAAAFDDDLIRQIGNVVGREGRAFGNNGFSGFDFWAPNMNPFRDPRWGRGQETPGEDIFHVQSYIRNYVPGLQGSDLNDKQVIATCKHAAVYDLETGRYGNDYNPTQQDLAEYFLAPFKTCVRDVNVGSVMCSYNAVDGVPSCANKYLLQDVIRDHWNFTAAYQYIVSDCGAVQDMWQYHNFTSTEEGAAAVGLNAGVDNECGASFITLNQSLALNHTTVARMDEALTRLYNALFTVGFFDGSQYSNIGWDDVATPAAQTLAYTAAVEGMTLLKNTKNFLPLNDVTRVHRVAIIGPYAAATSQMQGDYSGTPKYIRSPLQAFQGYNAWDVIYAQGTQINTNDTSGYAAALAAANEAEFVIYLGGIDNSLEAEENDRESLAWPGNQLDLISQLAATGKSVVVVQFGGGQVDDSALLSNANVKSLIWAGYPSQDGGPAILDVLTGAQSIAGRLPVTQYPASYADEVSIYNINLRPNGSYPGRTYKWYTGTPVVPFGYGLHYTTFNYNWQQQVQKQYNIQDLVNQLNSSHAINDNTPFASMTATVTNTGKLASDYVGLLFISSNNAGPTPRPNKSLVAYQRLHNIAVKGTQTLNLPLTLGSIARADENGSLVIYPGDYKLSLDTDGKINYSFTLRGKQAVIETLPPLPTTPYGGPVPVHTQAPSMQNYG